MELLTIVSLLAAIQFMVFGGLVGANRQRSGLKAPAITGDPIFERYFRVHYNTLEQLIAFYPGLWAFGWYVNEMIAAALGVVFLIGRIVYLRAYVADPTTRGPGMLITMIPVNLLVLGGLGGAVWSMIGR